MIDYFYEDDYVFDLDKRPGLNIAFGITYFDDNQEPIDDLDYGEVIGRVKTWGSEGGLQYQNLKLRPCTYQELGLDSPVEVSEDSKFYPVHKNSVQWLE